MVFVTHVILNAPYTERESLAFSFGLRELEPSIHAFGHDGIHAAVMLADIEADSESNARIEAMRRWDKCESVTGIPALGAYAIRDICEEERRGGTIKAPHRV